MRRGAVFPSPRAFIRLLDARLRDSGGNPIASVTIGFLPLSLGPYVPTLSTDIRVEIEYLRKIVLRHRIKMEALAALLPHLIRDSYCLQEKRNHLTFIGYCPSTDKPHCMVVKSAKAGTETWLVTLHRLKDEQVRTKLNRATARGQLFRELEQPFDE